MAKKCCRPTTSGDDLDPGGAGTIRHFKAEVARLEDELRKAREKLANWEPWMAALGRMLVEHRIVRFPDDVLAWREKLKAVEDEAKHGTCAVGRRILRILKEGD